MATLMAVLTLAFCLFVFNGGRKLFRDSDTGWHIRTGERILMTHSLPRPILIRSRAPGASWVAWEWGSDVLMGLAHQIDGLRGVTAMFALAIAACTWMWFRLHWAVGGNFYIACAMMPPMINTASLHWLARPHVFSWLFLIGADLVRRARALSLRPPAGNRDRRRNCAVGESPCELFLRSHHCD